MILSFVSTTQPYWYNKARVLEVLVKKWQGEDPDSSQMAMLEDIANPCPFEGGKGVYMARGILSEYILEEVIYDDLAKCDSQIPRTTSKSTSPNIEIYPNPVQDRVFIRSGFVMSGIQIFNSFGASVYDNNRILGRNHEISLDSFQDGVYYFSIYGINGEKIFKKVVIIH